MKRQKRESIIKRKTRETEIKARFLLDGKGRSEIYTGVPFLDHMLTLFSRHGLFDLDLKARGDLEVDEHHTVEDCGLALGEGLNQALGDKVGIKRFGFAYAPMDETLARVCLDLSGRPGFYFRTEKRAAPATHTDRNFQLIKEFLKAFSIKAGMNLHIDIIIEGADLHHVAEAVFKALGLALAQATVIDKRAKDIPSTKGRL